jgi:CRP-like cAMP-binding protein
LGRKIDGGGSVGHEAHPLPLGASFRKIFNLSIIQMRAELLKHCDFFHTQEIEKLKRIALYSRRCLAAKGQILVKEGDVLTHLIVVVSGEAQYIR